VRRWLLFLAALSLASVIAFLLLSRGGRPDGGVVSHVRDGDTIELADGEVVRLVQIDTPELHENECYSRKARMVLRRLLPVGARVRIVDDERLDGVDRYGRRLAYLFRGRANINLVLVERGAAAVWFFEGRRGRYASSFLAAERGARAGARGLWGACPGTPLDPLASVDSGVGWEPRAHAP
jgi:micrococcal nuclease